jgi:predicted RNA-binding Zn-ribbon protein involved in translation (DUF1610 family)/ADP-ribose pyrophosphatase YjhB (NUDIX family)
MERAELLQQLKQPKLIADLAAGAIAVLGLFGCFHQSQPIKTLSLSALIAGVGTLAGNAAIASLYAETAANVLDKELFRHGQALQLSESHVTELTNKVEEWKVFWGQKHQEIEAFNLRFLQTQKALATAQQDATEAHHYADLLQSSIDNLEAQISSLSEQEEQERQRGEALQQKLSQAQTSLTAAHAEAEESRSHVDVLQKRFDTLVSAQQRERQQFQRAFEALAVSVKQSMSDAVVEYRDRLLSAIESSSRQRPDDYRDRLLRGAKASNPQTSDLLPQLQRLAGEVKHVATDHLTHIANLPHFSDPQSFLKEAVSLLQQEFEELSALKVKYRNTLNTGDKLIFHSEISKQQTEVDKLRLELEQFRQDSIPRSQHEAILSEFQVRKDEAFQSVVEQAEALETELNQETDSYVQKLLNQIDLATREIARLKEQVDDLRKPHNFNPATRDDLRIGNQIIEYFWLHGIILDRAGSDYRKHEAVLHFHTDRNPRLVLPGELNEHADKLPQVLRCLNTPKFDYDSESGLMSVKLALSRKPPIGAEDVSRLWKSKSQFEKLASQWIRVRVIGGSEAGKSPTAENIAVCLLKAHPGKVKLSNPQYHSRKNYWSIPVTWTFHKESIEGMKEVAERVEKRSSGLEGFEEFVLYMFDEIDSTFVKHKSASQYVLSAVKQASHQNLGMVFIGQNANASEYPGMDRSDFENCVNVHIGGNAKHAIVNSNMSSELKSELQNQYDKLMEFCEAKNAELSLDRTDPQAYRFALVIEPQRKPYFIELPYFGCYTFDQVSAVEAVGVTEASNLQPSASSCILEAANPDSAVASEMASAPYIGVGCPKCSEGILSRTKKNRGSLLYVCDSCGKSTSESVLSAQSQSIQSSN